MNLNDLKKTSTFRAKTIVPIVGIGTTSVSSPLTVNGVIESKSGGVKFPDGSTQITAATGVFSDSYVTLTQANGFGSTNTRIARFANVIENVGTDITYADSATAGASFTINTTGVYSMNWTFVNNGNGFSVGFSRNSTQLSTSIQLVTDGSLLCVNTQPGTYGSNEASCSVTRRLSAGDVIRPHTWNQPSGTSANSILSIIRIR